MPPADAAPDAVDLDAPLTRSVAVALAELARGERTIAEMARAAGVAHPPLLSHHLRRHGFATFVGWAPSGRGRYAITPRGRAALRRAAAVAADDVAETIGEALVIEPYAPTRRVETLVADLRPGTTPTQVHDALARLVRAGDVRVWVGRRAKRHYTIRGHERARCAWCLAYVDGTGVDRDVQCATCATESDEACAAAR